MTAERWLPIPEYEGRYEVSDLGRVRGPRRILKPTRDGKGYLRVLLGRGSKRFRVHRLVLLAFVGPPESGQQCRHLDGDPANNILTNLAWGTPRENSLDQVRHGRHSEARKTACPQNHPYDGRSRRGKRICRTCQRAHKLRFKASRMDREEPTQHRTAVVGQGVAVTRVSGDALAEQRRAHDARVEADTAAYEARHQ